MPLGISKQPCEIISTFTTCLLPSKRECIFLLSCGGVNLSICPEDIFRWKFPRQSLFSSPELFSFCGVCGWPCVVVKWGFLCIHLMKNMTLIRSCNRVLGFLMNIFASPPMEDQGMLPAFKGNLKKTLHISTILSFWTAEGCFNITVILATGLKPFHTLSQEKWVPE